MIRLEIALVMGPLNYLNGFGEKICTLYVQAFFQSVHYKGKKI